MTKKQQAAAILAQLHVIVADERLAAVHKVLARRSTALRKLSGIMSKKLAQVTAEDAANIEIARGELETARLVLLKINGSKQ